MKSYVLLMALFITVQISLAATQNEDNNELNLVKRSVDNDEDTNLFDEDDQSDDNSDDNDDDDDDDAFTRNLVKRNTKYYKDAPKHPERLRGCVRCVGVQREKGMNVKQATDYCNKVCKRNLFEDDLAKRFYYWRQRG